MMSSNEEHSTLGDYVSDPEVVQAFTTALNECREHLKQQGLRGFAFVVVHGDGSQSTAFESGDSIQRLAWGLDDIRLRLQLASLEQG